MNTPQNHYEIFRRSSLTLLLDAGLAVGMMVAFTWFYLERGFPEDWTAFVVALLFPIGWVVSQYLRWYCQTWTATTEGLLIIHNGILPRSRQVIHLCSARDIETHSPFLVRWLGIGHINFRATGPQGLLQRFQWKWVKKCPRLCEILEGRGKALIEAHLSWKQRLVEYVTGWKNILKSGAKKELRSNKAISESRILPSLDDYDHFLTFCSSILRNPSQGHFPHQIPLVLARRWTMALQQASIISFVPESNHWQLAKDIHSVKDICDRIKREDLHRSKYLKADHYARPNLSRSI